MVQNDVLNAAREEDREVGREEVCVKGRDEGKIELVTKMVKGGFEIEAVGKISGISAEVLSSELEK